MSSVRIVFVAGLSGAGQSQAIKSFEDLGFYCVEHLPPITLDETIARARYVLERPDACDRTRRARRARLGDPCSAIDRIRSTHNSQMLFLEADDDLWSGGLANRDVAIRSRRRARFARPSMPTAG